MRVIDEALPRSRAKMTQLAFEDFLEALARVSAMKATPTDDEVAAAGCEDGGQWLLRLAEWPREYAAFTSQRAVGWDLAGRAVGGERARQPPWRAVAHVVSLLVRRPSWLRLPSTQSGGRRPICLRGPFAGSAGAPPEQLGSLPWPS